MTTWKDGGMYGQIRREIVSEDGSHPIAIVRVRQYLAGRGTKPWPKGEENFRLILNAPQMLEALEAIEAKAGFVSKTAGGPFAHVDWEMVLRTAHAAIAVAKGDSNDEKA